MKQFKFYSDPGHGWCAVKRKLLSELGILASVTRYSYERGETVYLEEDCDASKLFNALIEQKIRYKVIESYSDKDSPIRSYPYFGLRAGEG